MREFDKERKKERKKFLLKKGISERKKGRQLKLFFLPRTKR